MQTDGMLLIVSGARLFKKEKRKKMKK